MLAFLNRFGGYLLVLGVGVLLLVLASLVSSRTLSHEDIVSVDLSVPAVASGPGRQHLRLAVTSVWSPERTFARYYALADHMALTVGRPFRLVQRKTYGEVLELLRLGSVQAAIICTGAYLTARRMGIPLEVIAVPVYPEGPVYRSLFLVRASSSLQTVGDLRGRSFGFSDPLSMSGYYYPASVLAQLGVRPDAYFSRTLFTYSHDGSIRAVIDGIVDGAAVDSLVFESEAVRDPTLAHELRIVHRSPLLGVNPVVVPQALDHSLRESIRSALLRANSTPEGWNVLQTLGVVRFEAPAPDLYDGASRVVDAVLQPAGLERR